MTGPARSSCRHSAPNFHRPGGNHGGNARRAALWIRAPTYEVFMISVPLWTTAPLTGTGSLMVLMV